ncbi:MAG TPA: hypothetical protein VFU41_00785 [Gemmatimonadales bacterium]|nr:hypothetical protein [Gemmatimonadales bacterium]
MKRLALLLVAVALCWPAAANAQLTMQMSNGWSFTFAGNVNAFWVFTKGNTTAGDYTNSSVRTGLLPAFATFGAKGKEAGLDLGVHFGFAPQINNAAVHDQFGAQIDMRQVYLTIGGRWGQILAGRELGLFGRQNIINDMTLFGVGAVGFGLDQGGGTTLGRIGYGYLYPNFNAQLTYSTRGGRPGQFSIGLFQPSVLGFGTSAYGFTKIPRVEAEFTYSQKSGKNTYMFWAGGLWQTTSDAPTGGNSLSSFGGTAGVKAGISDLSVVVSGYIGKGLGTTLIFSGDEAGSVDPTKGRTSDGGYVQLTYKVGGKTTVGGSWGFSRLKHTTAGDGDEAVTSNLYAYTAGIYHQWTKSLKFVLEGTQEGTTGEEEGFFAGIVTGPIPPGAKQTSVSGGFMLFY